MSDVSVMKTERIHLRIDPEAKRLLERAASLANMTLSSFVASSALDTAGQLISERERLVLGERDWEAFFDALVHPPQPKEALRKAFGAHARQT